LKKLDVWKPPAVLSKPLTLDFVETLGLFFRWACYHQNTSYRKRKRINVVEKL
jgi:hypothetical protein